MEVKRRSRPPFFSRAKFFGGRPAVLSFGALAAGSLCFWMGGRYMPPVMESFRTARVYFAHARTRLAARRRVVAQRLTFDIKFKDYMKLSHKRQEALAKSVLIAGPEDFVDAEIRRGRETLRAKVRLKGDWVDHLNTEKWSLRARMKAGQSLFGMREFSIQHPASRNYIHEWVYHEMLAHEDVLAPRYDFVQIEINGQDRGIYALEEHFEKTLAESRRRREGPLLKFSEDLMWAERAQSYPDFEPSPGGYDHAGISPVEGFKMSRILSSPESAALYRKAAALLEGFRRGKIAPDKVFDYERMASFLALSALAGAHHAVLWHNIRFYYNPVVSRIEPIGFDGLPGRSDVKVETAGEEFLGLLLKDREFHKLYVGAIERVSQEAYLDAFFARISGRLEDKLAVLRSEYPGYPWTEDVYRRNAAVLRRRVYPIKALHAFFQEAAGGRLRLKAANIQSFPVDIYGLSMDDKPLFPIEKRTTLAAADARGGVNYADLYFLIPKGRPWKDEDASRLRLGYKILGARRQVSEAVFPWPYPEDLLLGRDLPRRRPNASEFPFVAIDAALGEIRLRRGTWTVDRHLIFPPGMPVVAGEGTRLDLKNGASLLSYSPLRFTGGEAAPIWVGSSDGSGGGVAVLGAKASSYFKRVRFENLARPAEGDWELTGAVTFYESPAEFESCEFVRARSEDSLNVVRGGFTLRRTLFSGSAADALDADFSEGVIEESAFAASGNDAMDFSGSSVRIKNVRVEGAGDKGLSAGESSSVQVAGLSVKNAAIGIASKDLSAVVANKVNVAKSRIGLAAYVKKPEFGGGLLTVSQLGLDAVENGMIVGENSMIEVDGIRKPVSAEPLLRLLEAFK